VVIYLFTIIHRLRRFQQCFLSAPDVDLGLYGSKTGARKRSRFMALISAACDMGITYRYFKLYEGKLRLQVIFTACLLC